MVKKTSWSSNYQNKTVNLVQDPKKTQPKATSSPICIDIDSSSEKSSRSGRTTRNSSKRKAEEVPKATKPKKAKKEVKKKCS